MNNQNNLLDFFSSHNHTEISNYRLKDCIIRVNDLIDRAIELGYKGVAITDHEAVSGHIMALTHLQELKDKGTLPEDFKLGLGNEIYLIDNLIDVTENYESGKTKYWHFILIAKDKKGHEQLRQISSESAWKNYFRQGGMERVPTVKAELEEIIGDDKGHLIASTACLGGELPYWCIEYFKNNNPDAKIKIHKFITWCIAVFGKENFFIELQPAALSQTEQSEKQAFINKCLVKLAKAYDLKYIVTTDSHYLKKEHRKVHEAYLNSDDNSNNREVGDFYETTYMMNTDEIMSMLSTHLSVEEVQTAISNTLYLYEAIETYDLSHSVIVPRDKKIPKFSLKHIFKDWYDKCEYIKKFAYSNDEQERYFLYLCENGFIKKGQEFNDTNIQRINTEMSEIWEISEKLGTRTASYYTLVRTIIHEIMWKVSYVGVARGSTTGFYTAYLLEIGQMNPLKYNLPHWRHAHKERVELADIDVDTEQSKRKLIIQGMRDYFGEKNILNTLTFKTEGSKSSVLTACRGLGIDNDTAQAIADLIPFERGSNWSISECYYGNEEKGRKPVTEFINEVNRFDGLKEVIFLIEGLISGRSIHASAVYIFDNGYLKQNSRMKAPNGEWITAFNMRDSDIMGSLKFDCLTIAALDKIHKTIDLLIENHYIEDQGSIKATYDKYINPDVIDYESPDMWKMIGENTLIDAFQFDTQQGLQAAKAVKPTSLTELATANSLMRLMAEDGEEQPVDTYVKHKADITIWYQEMKDYGLTDSEIKIVEPYLLPVYGVAETQEVVMRLSMDKNISNFTVAEANKLRKAIAKKKPKLLEETKLKFFKKGKETGASEILLNYVWNVQFKKSFGYSFSQCHTFPYSCICLQEMNLAYHYPKIFWNTACLTVNAGADEDNDDNKTTEYGKIAKAIGSIQAQGQKIALPDINKAKFGFVPDTTTNEIIFGLKSICGIGDTIAKVIVDNQSYTSLNDFLNKMQKYKDADKENKFGEGNIITLIKAGCFDKLEGKPREEIMKDYIYSICKPVTKLTVTQLPLLKELGILTKEQEQCELKMYNFKNYVCQKQFFVKSGGKSDSTNYYELEPQFALPYFYREFEVDMIEGKDYETLNDGRIIVKKGSLEREFKKKTANFTKTVLQSSETLERVNQYKFEEKWKEKAEGDISKWEMSALSFYFHKHELANIDKDEYLISDFNQLSETPVVVDYYKRKDKDIPRFQLYRICGTVLDKNKNKHLVTLLTPTGVVNVKFYKGQFVFYDKQLSEIEEDGTKKTIEKSWFSRGNKLLVTGIRRGEQFVPKKYKDSAYKHSIQLITEINNNGKLTMQSERTGYEEDVN